MTKQHKLLSTFFIIKSYRLFVSIMSSFQVDLHDEHRDDHHDDDNHLKDEGGNDPAFAFNL